MESVTGTVEAVCDGVRRVRLRLDDGRAILVDLAAASVPVRTGWRVEVTGERRAVDPAFTAREIRVLPPDDGAAGRRHEVAAEDEERGQQAGDLPWYRRDD